MVRAEPLKTRRPAAPGPVRHTQRPGAGRLPPTPPLAESAATAAAVWGICPLAWPGGRVAKLRRHLGADEARGTGYGKVGGGKAWTKRGREERRDPPRPRPILGPPGRHHRAPRGKVSARARTGDFSLPPPPTLKPRPNLLERPAQSLYASGIAALRVLCASHSQSRGTLRAGKAGRSPETGRPGGRASRDGAAMLLFLRYTPLPWPSQI